jgi:hypothetical protein
MKEKQGNKYENEIAGAGETRKQAKKNRTAKVKRQK